MPGPPAARRTGVAPAPPHRGERADGVHPASEAQPRARARPSIAAATAAGHRGRGECANQAGAGGVDPAVCGGVCGVGGRFRHTRRGRSLAAVCGSGESPVRPPLMLAVSCDAAVRVALMYRGRPPTTHRGRIGVFFRRSLPPPPLPLSLLPFPVGVGTSRQVPSMESCAVNRI